MNPQQPSQQPSPGSEYDFFMNPEKPPKPNPFGNLMGSNSMAVRLIIVLAGIFILLIIFTVVISLLRGGGSEPKLLIVAQDQTELIRVANQANQNGSAQASQTSQNFGQSASFSLQTEQQQLLSFMAAHGTKPSPAQLSATKNANTDSQLANAIAASNFDLTFKNVMRQQLTNYQAALTAAYKSAKNGDEKQMLSGDYDAATLLLKQLGNPNQ